MLITLINILILLTMPLLMIGMINKTKAFWAGRKGASIFQPMFDFIKLMKKETVYSETTSWIFNFMPVLMFSSVLFAGLFVPLVSGTPIIIMPFGFVIFSYILGFGKFFSLISALDTGSSFEGMGASREACFSTIVEPAFFISMGSIVALTNSYNFNNLKLIMSNSSNYGILIVILLSITLFIMLLTEGSRVPVDDPNTHLELTMIHEVMILDNSGSDLGLITYASAMKMFLIEALIASLIIPSNLTLIPSIFMFLAVIFLLSLIIGTIEAITARYRMTHVFEFIFIMSITSLLVLTLVTYRIYGN